jgi:predicted O-methyltransferase YrrM
VATVGRPDKPTPTRSSAPEPPAEERPPLWPSAEEAAASPFVFTRFPPGHFYSPLPDTRELSRDPRRSQVWPLASRDTPEIEWREAEQVELCLQEFAHQDRLSFAVSPTGDETTYFTENDQYPALDAWLLEAFLRRLEPQRMIEVGSGFSTLVSARVNRELLGGSMRLTCIEPYPRAFLADLAGVSELRQEQVQDTPSDVFEELTADDVLFIDSSHVSKTGSDVNWLQQEVFPRLNVGVVVHIHDIFLPGDYPQAWVLDGWGWNELYLVRAFLAYNFAFQIELGAFYMLQHQPNVLKTAFPKLAAPDHFARGGASLWIRKVA